MTDKSEKDIETLRQFINLNSQVFRHYMDYNNNGIFDEFDEIAIGRILDTVTKYMPFINLIDF